MEIKDKKEFVRNLIINIIFLVIGLIAGVAISGHFYKKSQKDYKKELLESALLEMSINIDKDAFVELNDSLRFLETKYPYPLLESHALRELAVNSRIFKNNGDIFLRKVYGTKFNVDAFNQRIEGRNFIIILNQSLAIEQNSHAYSFYQNKVKPKLIELYNYIEEHQEELLK